MKSIKPKITLPGTYVGKTPFKASIGNIEVEGSSWNGGLSIRDTNAFSSCVCLDREEVRGLVEVLETYLKVANNETN